MHNEIYFDAEGTLNKFFLCFWFAILMVSFSWAQEQPQELETFRPIAYPTQSHNRELGDQTPLLKQGAITTASYLKKDLYYDLSSVALGLYTGGAFGVGVNAHWLGKYRTFITTATCMYCLIAWVTLLRLKYIDTNSIQMVSSNPNSLRLYILYSSAVIVSAVGGSIWLW